MAEVKVECMACRSHYLVDDFETECENLSCIKCGAQTFAVLDPEDVSAEPTVGTVRDVTAESRGMAGATPATGAGSMGVGATQSQAAPSRSSEADPAASPSASAAERVVPATIAEVQRLCNAICSEMKRVIVGQQEVTLELLVALLCGGHCLVEGAPGVPRALLIASLAKALQLPLGRIQLSPQLVPADGAGAGITHGAAVRPGAWPDAAGGAGLLDLVLVEEIDCRGVTTQEVLIEAMQAKTRDDGVAGCAKERALIVMATRCPQELGGGTPLPEAWQDCFMLKVLVDYPAESDEREIVRQALAPRSAGIQPVCSGETILAMQRAISEMPVTDAVIAYASRLVRATRRVEGSAPQFVEKGVAGGAGPRATIELVRAARCFAAMAGNPTPSCDDITRAALPVLRHRLCVNASGKAAGLTADVVIARLLEEIRP